MKCNWGKFGLFCGGFLFGTAGLKILASRGAKKVYVHTTAAALRAKDSVMTSATAVREGAKDIVAQAKELNETYEAKAADAVIEDESGESAEEVAEEAAEEATEA